MALWRSWLARRPVTAEVAGSSPVRVAHSGEKKTQIFSPLSHCQVGECAIFRAGPGCGGGVRAQTRPQTTA